MLKLIEIKKDYQTAGNSVQALKGVNLRFRKNEFVSILGASGCGKTTMLNIIGGLDHYTSGDLVINGISTKEYADHDWDVYRNHRIGFVFQSYNLIPHQTVLGNVEIALTIAGVSKAERRVRAEEALRKVGLGEELNKHPNQLSGGQMQRVAIARALVNNPEILLADEPTGALDSETSVQIMDIIREVAGERLVIMVTHNPELAEQYSSRIVRLQDGLVVSDSNPYEMNDPEEISSIEESEKTVEDELEQDNAETVEEIAVANAEADLPAPDLSESATTLSKASLKEEKKAAKLAAKQAKKEEKKARKEAKRAAKEELEKSSMSFKTSLELSAKNLAMKKGRTIVTSVAGSIGIISVCLVLALSNGFNQYIAKTQEDMLASSPLQIQETTLDTTAIITGMTSNKKMPDLDEIGNKVYVNSFLTSMAQGMTVKNDLSDEYVRYVESMDKDLYSTILYGTGMNVVDNLFTEVQISSTLNGGGETTAAMALSEVRSHYTQKLQQASSRYNDMIGLVDLLGSVHGRMPGTKNVDDPSFGKYVLSQYDVIAGEFPTSANQAVLVVGGNNDMTDLTLAQLGFISEKEFLGYFTTEEKDASMLPFETIFNKPFFFYYNDALYQPTVNPPEGSGLPRPEYLYDYSGRTDTFATDINDETKGSKITISGILRLKDDLNYGCLGSGLYMTEQLYDHHLEKNYDSAISKDLRKQQEANDKFFEYMREMEALDKNDPDYNTRLEAKAIMMTGVLLSNSFKPVASTVAEYYQAGSDWMKGDSDSMMMELIQNKHFLIDNSAVSKMGASKQKTSISIYTDSFESKAAILEHLDEWNDTHGKEQKVVYTDTVGMIMGMVETILDSITYVLVAFTAISLVVSSVMIGIITYVSVVERVKEIGVLRSLGARKKDIKDLFNAETFIIGLAAGVFGVVVTYILSIFINLLLGTLTGISTLASLPITSALIMIAVSVGLTLISGLIPAKAAAEKDPVVALRTE